MQDKQNTKDNLKIIMGTYYNTTAIPLTFKNLAEEMTAAKSIGDQRWINDIHKEFEALKMEW